MRDFVLDYYPNLITKLTNIEHQPKLDKEGLVLTEPQAKDRAYLLLQEVIRVYRLIKYQGFFDPRIWVFSTVFTEDEYRSVTPAELYFLVQSVSFSDNAISITGTEFGADVLE